MTTVSTFPNLPPDAAALLDDPRLEGMRPKRPGFSSDTCILMPAQGTVEGQSHYLLFSPRFDESPSSTVVWENEPSQSLACGGGRGFSPIIETPVFRESRKKPAQLRDAWEYLGWLIASPVFAEVVRRFEPQATQTVAMDWIFSDDRKLDGYVFLDICKFVDAYDYNRSEVKISAGKGTSKYVVGLGQRRSLRSTLDPKMHAFRDAYFTEHLFVSRELARELLKAGIRQVDFVDPATMNAVRLADLK